MGGFARPKPRTKIYEFDPSEYESLEFRYRIRTLALIVSKPAGPARYEAVF